MANVTYRREGRIAFVDFSGEGRNLITSELRLGLHEAFQRYKGDDEAWIAVFASDGPDFCAGSQGGAPGGTAARREFFSYWAGGYHEIWKPTIAAIQGSCAGEGAALALGCDFRIAEPSASFDFAFTGDGSQPQVAAAWLLTIVGLSKALELVWLGEPVTVQEALRLGLVNRIARKGPAPEPPQAGGRLPMDPLQTEMTVEDGSARTAAKAFAEELLLNAPVTRRFQKEIAYRSIGVPFQYAQSLEIGKNPLGSADRIEGNRAFVENRRPVWQNE
jgi:enoyl-CoA hydratase/carnithine racemase